MLVNGRLLTGIQKFSALLTTNPASPCTAKASAARPLVGGVSEAVFRAMLSRTAEGGRLQTGEMAMRTYAGFLASISASISAIA